MSQPIIRPEIQQLVELLQKSKPAKLYDPDANRIQVSHIMTRISSFYEKIRNAVDYNEEHLIRKNAIQRILKRRIRVSLQRKTIARGLIHELIRSKYLENNFVPEIKVPQVETVIQKYLFLLDALAKYQGIAARFKYFDWLTGIAACEIEEKLDLLTRDNALVNAMFGIMKQDILFTDKQIDPQEVEIQLYISIHRSLIKSDQSILAFHLTNLYYPYFREATEEQLLDLAQNFHTLRKNIDYQLRNPLAYRLSRLLKRQTVFFTILRDVIDKDEDAASNLMQNTALFEEHIKTAALKRYQTARGKLSRSIVNSVIYIFLTKIILAFILELPYDVFVLDGLHLLPLSINVFFPPFLMFLIASSAHIPSGKNTQAIIEGVKQVTSADTHDPADYHLKSPSRRAVWKTFFFSLIYLSTFVISFGTIIVLLAKLRFNVVSIFLFLLFLCVVSFFGIKIRHSVKELNVLSVKQGVIGSLLDFLFLPILQVGRWISVRFSRINLFAFALDFVIEAPLKTVIEVVEDWFSFMKEKKEEIY